MRNAAFVVALMRNTTAWKMDHDNILAAMLLASAPYATEMLFSNSLRRHFGDILVILYRHYPQPLHLEIA